MSAVDIDIIATDAMDFVDRFCEVAHPNNPEAKSALRQEIVGHVVAYLKDDSVCDYGISKRVLTQTWDDYKPNPAQSPPSGQKTLFERVQAFYSTPTYEVMRKMLQNSGNGGRLVDITQREIQGAVLAYAQHYNNHTSFNNFSWKNHLLGGRNLLETADNANNKILQEAALHVLLQQPNAKQEKQANTTEDAQELLDQILNILSKAHQYRQNLAAALVQENTPELSLAAVLEKRKNAPTLTTEDGFDPFDVNLFGEDTEQSIDTVEAEPQDEMVVIEDTPPAQKMKP